MKETIKQYLDQLNERERRAVIIAAIALLIYLPYQIIWSPFQHSVTSLKKRVMQQESDLTWMKERIPEIIELSRSSNGVSSSQPVYGVIESSARQRFGNDIRVQQEGKGGVRVTINNISFDDLMLWLDELYYRQHINVREFTATRQSAPGRVDANILIES